MLNTPLITEHIRTGQIHLIKEVMSKSGEQGMQTLDKALLDKYCAGEITAEEAIRCADSANEVRLGIKMFDKRRSSYANVDLQVDSR